MSNTAGVAGTRRGSHVDGAHMQEAAVAASGMRIHLRAPKIHAELCQVSSQS